MDALSTFEQQDPTRAAVRMMLFPQFNPALEDAAMALEEMAGRLQRCEQDNRYLRWQLRGEQGPPPSRGAPPKTRTKEEMRGGAE